MAKGIRVKKIETGEEYKSVREAGIKNGISDMTVWAALRRKDKSGGGFHWERIERNEQ